MVSRSSQESGYVDLSNRIVRRLKSAKIQHRIVEALQQSFDVAIAEEQVVLSRAERKRLLAQISQQVLEDLLKKLGNSSAANE